MDLKLFGSTFFLIFLAELPDKTLLTNVLFATRGYPLAVFIGAAAAFLIQSMVAVLFGGLLSLMPVSWVHQGSGILFLVFAILLWVKKPEEVDPTRDSNGSGFRRTVAATFLAIFMAEWGDLTQLATMALEAKYRSPVTILVSATAALWAVTALGVWIGHRARAWIRPRLLQKAAALAFLACGIFLLLKS